MNRHRPGRIRSSVHSRPLHMAKPRRKPFSAWRDYWLPGILRSFFFMALVLVWVALKLPPIDGIPHYDRQSGRVVIPSMGPRATPG